MKNSNTKKSRFLFIALIVSLVAVIILSAMWIQGSDELAPGGEEEPLLIAEKIKQGFVITSPSISVSMRMASIDIATPKSFGQIHTANGSFSLIGL